MWPLKLVTREQARRIQAVPTVREVNESSVETLSQHLSDDRVCRNWQDFVCFDDIGTHERRLWDFNNFSASNTNIVWPTGTRDLNSFPSFIPSVTNLTDLTGGGWYSFENVCVNGQDHIRYLREHRFEEVAKSMGLNSVTEPFKVEPFDAEEFVVDSLTDTYVLRGTSLILGCWRSGRTHPYHFMFGFGKFYRFIRSQKAVKPFDNIIFFQCPDVSATEFFQESWRMIFHVGFKLNFIDSNTRLYRTNSNDDDDRKHSLCTENALFHPSVGTLLGYPSEEKFFEMWRNDFDAYVRTVHSDDVQLRAALHRMNLSAEHMRYETRELCLRECTSKLRVSIFERSSGTSRRSIVNTDEVNSMLIDYVESVEFVTLNESSSFIDTLRIMNQFDIMISTYGSHLVNILFTLSPNTAVIEVSGTCFDSNEFPMMTHYFRSFGHMPVGDPSLLDILERCSQVVDSCSAPDDSPCPMEDRYKIFVSDISVNTTLLHETFEKTAATVCAAKCSAFEQV